MADTSAELLRLLALDADDLPVLAAHMQDAVVRRGDMSWLPKQRRFALVGCRFNWMAAHPRLHERRFAGMHFDSVTNVQRSGLDPATPDAMHNLLSLVFAPDEAPSGVVTLIFSGGGSVRLQVECVDAQLRDLGACWSTPRKPGHADAPER